MVLSKQTAASLNLVAYRAIRESIMSGGFQPGQKLSTRKIAMAMGIGLTPVREALVRLVGEHALVAMQQRSARIPILTRERVLDVMQLRMMLEGHAAERAAQSAQPEEIETLRQISIDIMAARQRRETALDIRKIYEFHFTLYRCAQMPDLMGLIESLWLRTGPYLNLLFPDYASRQFGDGRGRILQALQQRDGATARTEIEDDIRNALSYIAETIPGTAEP